MKSIIIIAALAGAAPAMAQSDALWLKNPQESSANYLVVADAPALRPQTLTVECWFRADGPGYGNSNDGFGPALVARPGQGTAGSHLESWGLYWSPVSQHALLDIAHVFATSGQTVFSTKVIPVGEWHHVAGTFDGSMLRIYVDGVFDSQVAAGFTSVDYSRSDDVLIGASNFAFGWFRRWQGAIDEVRVWNYPRSAEQIASAWNSATCGPQPGLVAAWSFSGGSLADVTGNGHTAAPATSVAFTAPPANLRSSADFNGDGFTDIYDFNDFVDCFEGTSCPPGKTADFNNDGFADIYDFNDFVDAFEAGC